MASIISTLGYHEGELHDTRCEARVKSRMAGKTRGEARVFPNVEMMLAIIFPRTPFPNDLV